MNLRKSEISNSRNDRILKTAQSTGTPSIRVFIKLQHLIHCALAYVAILAFSSFAQSVQGQDSPKDGKLDTSWFLVNANDGEYCRKLPQGQTPEAMVLQIPKMVVVGSENEKLTDGAILKRIQVRQNGALGYMDFTTLHGSCVVINQQRGNIPIRNQNLHHSAQLLVERSPVFKPFALVSRKNGKRLTSDEIEAKMMCRSSLETAKESRYLLDNFDPIGTGGDHLLTSIQN